MSGDTEGIPRCVKYGYLEEHIRQKKAIYERYEEGFKDLPVHMNPFDSEKCEPNYWLSAMIIDTDAMCRQVRGETDALYVAEQGKSCPTEILEAISAINAEEANLETDAYAANVPNERVCNSIRFWKSKNKCLYRRWY